MIKTSHLFLAASLLAPGVAAAQEMTTANQPPLTPARRAALMKSALSAAPKHIADGATVMAPGPDGKMIELRQGTNGFTCFPDDIDNPGPGPMCADAEGVKWATAYLTHAPRPDNTSPGLIYMLAGGTDVSATDPWAKPGTGGNIKSPPHWMLMWPIDAEATGLSTTPKTTGTWVMWAGTPYAHLMINQVP